MTSKTSQPRSFYIKLIAIRQVYTCEYNEIWILGREYYFIFSINYMDKMELSFTKQIEPLTGPIVFY